MTVPSPMPSPNPTPEHPATDRLDDHTQDTETRLQQLRRKQGNWVEWGQSCQILQKQGLTPQAIFEATGFEPIQQNQIIVAAQVFKSILGQGVSGTVRSHFEQRGSDTLYEFRILSQTARAKAATLVLEKGIDSEGSREVAKAIRDYTQMSQPPEGFAPFDDHPGDAVAYHYWRLARQQGDLQSRSRLIAMGLKFASSAAARQAIETLLTDFTVESQRPAPTLPSYRLDDEDTNPRIVPVVGHLPLSVSDVKAVPFIEEHGPFNLVKFSGTGAWIPLPGWQVVRLAEDPVVVLARSDELSGLRVDPMDSPEQVLVVVDRARRQWSPDHYFLTTTTPEAQTSGSCPDPKGEQAPGEARVTVQWSDEPINTPILGQVVLVLWPKRILDENLANDPWQVE
ncbi:MAG: RuBisCO accumulation factor 1 [Leptolyngbyaceae bacterium]|nr:RuBisCO accumulation factor 1 [Leptolyngbyaceae bacterium]